MHLVLLALGAKRARLARPLLAAILDVVVERNDLGPDEALFEIGVNDAGALRRLPSTAESPRADFLWPRSEETRKTQRVVCELDRPVERRLREPVALKKLLCLGIGKPRKVRFHLCAHDDALRALLRSVCLERVDMRVALARHVVVGDVRAVDDLLIGEEMEFLQDVENRVAFLPRKRTDGLSFLEMLQKRRARLGLRAHRGLRLRLLLDTVVALLQLLHVGEDKFRLDYFRVAHGIDRRRLVAAFLDVDDVVVLEAPDDMEYRVALADVREELVSEALALGRTLDETGDVGELDRRAYYLLRAYDLRKRLKPRVCDFDNGGVGLDRAERVVLCRRLLLLGKRVEQCGLADVGKPYNSY